MHCSHQELESKNIRLDVWGEKEQNLLYSLGERGAHKAGLNVTWSFYIVRQDQAGCVYDIFLLLPEDGLPQIYFEKILDKECFDTMKVIFFIIGFFFGF